MRAPNKTANRLLARMPQSDRALLQPDLETVELPLRRQLEQRNRPIEHVYFLDSGLASVVANVGADHSVEVCIVGFEGMTGWPVLLDTDRSTFEAFIQTAGTAQRIPSNKLCAAMAARPSLRLFLLRYVNTVMAQMGHTALANGRYKLEERLARWLLMADDRALGAPLHLTHEFLALMLGTRRPGVTVALQEFHRRGVIETKRSLLLIKDRGALEDAANGSYGAPELEYRRLFD